MNNQLMNPEQTDLYQRIQAFVFDHPDASFSFSKRLAKDNGWSDTYTQRVIDEYRKFVFLAVVAGHPVTPSDQVDQVWHQHLGYSRSYWQDFCPNVLQTPLHHEPTQGGRSEQLKFDDWYTRTLNSYQSFFGQSPPTDIWSPPRDRFSRDLCFQRLNLQQHWIIPKPTFKPLRRVNLNQLSVISLLFIVTIALSGCNVTDGIPNPLNFNGGEFLMFYICSIIFVIFLAVQLRRFLRFPSGRSLSMDVGLDAYETAYLVNGQGRVVETAIASLIQKEFVVAQKSDRKLILQRPIEELSHPVEQAVANAILADGSLTKVRGCKIPSSIRERLEQLKLLVSAKQSLNVQHYPALLISLLCLLGVVKIFVGISRGKPVGFLIFLVIFLAIIGFFFWLTPPHQSRYGDRVVRNLQSLLSSRAVGATDIQLPLACALWGTTILPMEYGDFKAILNPPSSSSSGGGGDGGGCGGGGCGGCGGCGGG